MSTEPTRRLNVAIPEGLYRRIKSRAGAELVQLQVLVPLLLEKGLDALQSPDPSAPKSRSAADPD